MDQLTINGVTPSANDFMPIRNADNSTWGYGARLLLDAGAQIISYHDHEAGFGVTMYGFGNQMSWGYTGGMGLIPVQSKCRCMHIFHAMHTHTHMHMPLALYTKSI